MLLLSISLLPGRPLSQGGFTARGAGETNELCSEQSAPTAQMPSDCPPVMLVSRRIFRHDALHRLSGKSSIARIDNSSTGATIVIALP
jgi:hypothetical protein